MKKSMKKFIAMVLTSLCVLGVPMIAFAGTASTQSTPTCGCGGTGVYSNTVQVYEKVTTHNHEIIRNNTVYFVSCTLTVKGYDNIYRCSSCGAELRTSYTEEIHKY